MRHLAARVALGVVLPLGLFSACGVDGRGLTYEFHALEAAGSTAAGAASHGGNTSSGASAGEGGARDNAASAGEAGEASHTSFDSSGQGGSSTMMMIGGSADGPSAAGAPAGGTLGSGATETGGAPGASDASSFDECGDVNHSCGPTLVQNPGFDTTATGWVGEPSMTATWDATDSASQPNSGSLLLYYTAPVASAAGFSMGGAAQCIPTAPDTDYDVALRLMIAAGQSGGTGGMNVWMYDDTACQGNLVSASTPLLGGTRGQWAVLRGTLWVPGDVHSLLIRLVASKPFSQAELKVFVDDVLFAKH